MIIKVQATVEVGMILTKQKPKTKAILPLPETVIVTAIGQSNLLVIDAKNREEEESFDFDTVQAHYAMSGYDSELRRAP